MKVREDPSQKYVREIEQIQIETKRYEYSEHKSSTQIRNKLDPAVNTFNLINYSF